MKRTLLIAATMLGLMTVTAKAGVHIDIGIGLPAWRPPVVVAPPPVVVAPAPVVVAPAPPVYYAPPPVVVHRPVVIYEPRPHYWGPSMYVGRGSGYYYGRHHGGHHHGHGYPPRVPHCR